MFKCVCVTAETMFINNKITNSADVVKTTWNIMNSESGRVKPPNLDFQLRFDDTFTSIDAIIANIFGLFFTGIPISTTTSLNSSPIVTESLLKENIGISFTNLKFRHVFPNDSVKAIKSIDIKIPSM